eukprot:13462654-Heterocapsa_arctica.AAC.1
MEPPCPVPEWCKPHDPVSVKRIPLASEHIIGADSSGHAVGPLNQKLVSEWAFTCFRQKWARDIAAKSGNTELADETEGFLPRTSLPLENLEQ